MEKLEYELSNASQTIWIGVGILLGFVTLFQSFLWFYPFFFERRHWYTRKNLLRYLQTHPVPRPEASEGFGYTWTIETYRLHLWDDSKVSLHTEAMNCILCNFNCAGLDRQRYKKIKQILQQSIDTAQATISEG